MLLESAIDKIRSAPLELLQDPSWLEYRFLPELGLNDRHMHQYPKELHEYCGIGINSWQYPCQFSKYLVHLSKQNITSYVEIGCHKGGTFIVTTEFLSRFNRLEQAVAVDNWERAEMHAYAELNSSVKYIAQSSQSTEFRELIGERHWDLILIDGDHSYGGATTDLNLVKDFTRRIAFHDIVNHLCPGTQLIWSDVKKRFPEAKFQEWTEQYDDVLLRLRGGIMGLGLMEF